jgi:hypothetical protein
VGPTSWATDSSAPGCRPNWAARGRRTPYPDGCQAACRAPPRRLRARPRGCGASCGRPRRRPRCRSGRPPEPCARCTGTGFATIPTAGRLATVASHFTTSRFPARSMVAVARPASRVPSEPVGLTKPPAVSAIRNPELKVSTRCCTSPAAMAVSAGGERVYHQFSVTSITWPAPWSRSQSTDLEENDASPGARSARPYDCPINSTTASTAHHNFRVRRLRREASLDDVDIGSSNGVAGRPHSSLHGPAKGPAPARVATEPAALFTHRLQGRLCGC